MISTNRLRFVASLGVLVCLLTVPLALSQDATQDSSSRPCNPALAAAPAGADPCQQPDNADQTVSAAKPQPANVTYTPAANGGPALMVQQPGGHFRYLIGASTTQGYDSAVASPFTPIGSYFSTYEGYLAGAWAFTHTYLVLQQDSTLTYLGSSRVEGHAFHNTAALATGEFNPNLSWILEAHSMEGDNSLTLLNPLPETIVGGVGVPAPGSAFVGLNEGFVWSTDVVGTVNWKIDRHDQLSFRAENANRQFFDLDLHDNQAIFSAEYKRELSQKTYVGAYGITRHQTGTVICDDVGFGLLGQTRPTDRIILAASGGPEFDSTGCRRHQGFDFHFSAAYRLHPRVWSYLTANREYSSGFLPNGIFEDNIGLGFSSRITRNLTWDVSGGYSRGFATGFILPVMPVTSYHGFYAQTSFVQRLSNSFSLELAYRYFDSTAAGLTAQRNVVFATLRWSPRRHDAWRTEQYPYPPPPAPEDSRSKHEE